MIVKDTNTGSSDDEVLYSSPNIDQFDQHIVQALSGSITVQAAYVDNPGASDWSNDLSLTSLGTGIERLDAKVKRLRVLQDGTTNAQARVAHASTAVT